MNTGSEPEGNILRLAKPEDALCLSVLATQVFLDTYATEGIRPVLAREVVSSYSESTFEDAIESDEKVVLVAERNNHLVGFSEVSNGAVQNLAPTGTPCELFRLYVQERFTGIGIGSLLLNETEKICREAGFAVIWLTPWVHNHRAIRFYERRGYQDYGSTFFEMENERHVNRVYAKRLADGGSA